MNLKKKKLEKTHCRMWDVCYRKFHCGKGHQLLLVENPQGLDHSFMF